MKSPPTGGLTPMARLNAASRTSRLHLALLLVGWVKLPADQVLELTWADLDLDGTRLRCGQQHIVLGDRLAELFVLHAARQRLDYQRADLWCPPGPGQGRVFVDPTGRPYSQNSADAELAALCHRAGLPAVPLAGLRHPVMRG